MDQHKPLGAWRAALLLPDQDVGTPLVGAQGGDIGLRKTFADIAATLSAHLGIAQNDVGTSFLEKIAANA